MHTVQLPRGGPVRLLERQLLLATLSDQLWSVEAPRVQWAMDNPMGQWRPTTSTQHRSPGTVHTCPFHVCKLRFTFTSPVPPRLVKEHQSRASRDGLWRLPGGEGGAVKRSCECDELNSNSELNRQQVRRHPIPPTRRLNTKCAAVRCERRR